MKNYFLGVNNFTLKLMALVPLFLSVKYAAAQSSFPKQLVGSWISLEYENILASRQGEKIRELVSPQFLYFDSLGTCTIQTRMEFHESLGKPIGQRAFGNQFQFTYNIHNKSKLNVNQIENENNLIYISFSSTPVSAVFKRYK